MQLFRDESPILFPLYRFSSVSYVKGVANWNLDAKYLDEFAYIAGKHVRLYGNLQLFPPSSFRRRNIIPKGASLRKADCFL